MRRPEKYCPFGASTINRQLVRLMEHLEDARSMDDPEGVHQLRVASRRLRASLPVFRECFQGSKRYLPRIKQLTRSLGAARDLDVQIMYLKGLKKEYRRRRMGDGIDFLLNRKERQRAEIQPIVLASIEDIKGSMVLEELLAECASFPPPSPSLSLNFLANDFISIQYEALLSLSDALESEAAGTRQHAMRIAAKKLRYTLEIFAELFEGKLATELSFLKRLQDILGELHDCDVWLGELSRAKDLANGEGNILAARGLALFQVHMMDRRHRTYLDAISLWSGRQGSLNMVEKAYNSDAVLPASGKVAIISDIHGNHHALRAVVRDARVRGATLFLNAGDSVGFGALPEQVLDEISGDGFVSIMGNFDKDVLRHPRSDDGGQAEEEKLRSMAQTRKVLSPTSRTFLGSLPKSLRLHIGSHKVVMHHASPLSKKEQITSETPESRLLEIAEEAEAELVIVGHSHQQFLRLSQTTTIINPGSVGRPGDGDPRAGYALMDPQSWTFELLRVPYDIEAAVVAIRKEKLPEHFAQMLIRGRSLDSVIEEETTIPQERSEETEAQALQLVRALTDTMDPDQAHTESVRSHAMALFDELRPLHNMGAEERYLLEVSALLHDIGWSKEQGRHHVSSMEIILNDQTLPLNTRERYMIASIARYHNSLPKSKHYNYSVLTGVDRRTVMMVASILRIADSLDASHQGAVNIRSIANMEDRVIIRGTSVRPSGEEFAKFQAKKDLFEKAFRKRIDLELQRIAERPRSASRSHRKPS